LLNVKLAFSKLFRVEVICAEALNNFELFVEIILMKIILFNLIFGLAVLEVSVDVVNKLLNTQYEIIHKDNIRRLLYNVGIPVEILMFIINAAVYMKTGKVLF